MRKNDQDMSRYDDIINLPAHISGTRTRMPVADRAAQFSPFAALTGYEDAIKETSRLTDEKIELDETEKAKLDEKLAYLQEQPANRHKVEVVYFLPDEMKEGGEYVHYDGIVKKIEGYDRMVIMEDGQRIPIEDIADISGDVFRGLDDRYA